MKLSVCTGHFEARFGLERAFEIIKAGGFDAIDFNIDDYWHGDEAKAKLLRCVDKSEDEIRAYYDKINGYLAKSGLEVGQTHSVFGPGFFKDREFYERVTRKNIFETHLLNSRYTVIHPIITPGRIFDEGYEECHKLNLEFFRSLIPDLEKYDVKIGIEPMWTRDAERDIRPTVCSRPEEILAYIDELDSDRFCSCPDLGHIALTGADTGDTVGGALRKLGSTVEIIHAHEVTTNNDAHTKPFTYGSMDWADIGAALREIGYKGTLNFEVGAGYYANYPDELIVESLRHLSEIGKYIISK
jgi:sugar phosphate isomerase/epimerase